MTGIAPLARRRAGILLHPTSLPGLYGNGDLGPHAYRFVDFLANCGFGVWPLPLGPPHDDLSPYSAQSVHAGNPRLIALEPLLDAGWLRPDGGPGHGESGWAYRQRRLREARAGFASHNGSAREAYAVFQHHHADWLDDYALYQAIRAQQQRAWFDSQRTCAIGTRTRWPWHGMAAGRGDRRMRV